MVSSDELLSKIRDLNRFRAAQWGRAVGSVPGGIQAAQHGGIDAMRKHVESWFPQPKRIDPGAVVAAKAKLVDTLADLQKSRANTIADLGSSMAKQGDKLKAVLDFFSSLFGDYARTAVDASRAEAEFKTDLSKKYSDLMMSSLDHLYGGIDDPGRIEGWAREIINDPNIVGTTPEGVFGLTPMGVQEMARSLSSYSPKDAQARLFYLSVLPGGRQILEAIEASGGQSADPNMVKLYQIYKGANDRVSDLEAIMAQQVNDFMFWRLVDTEVTGPPGMKSVVDAAMDFLSKLPPDASPEQVENALRDTVENVIDAPESKIPQEKAIEILDQLDQDVQTAPSGILEARQRLFDDPTFQAQMKAEGYTDEATFLKVLRQRLRDRILKNKLHDARKMREERLAAGGRRMQAPGALPRTAAAKQEAASAAASGDIGQAAEKGGTASAQPADAATPAATEQPAATKQPVAATVSGQVYPVRDPRTGELQVYDQGEFRKATDKEAEAYAALVELDPSIEEGASKRLIEILEAEAAPRPIPSSRPHEEALPGLPPVPASRPLAGLPPRQKPPTLRTATLTAADLLTRPGAALSRAEARVRDLLAGRKKKDEQAEDELFVEEGEEEDNVE